MLTASCVGSIPLSVTWVFQNPDKREDGIPSHTFFYWNLLRSREEQNQLKVMKKLLLTIVVAAVAAGSAMAQGYEKNLFGVRAGLNVSNVSMDYFAPKSKAGFHVAGVY